MRNRASRPVHPVHAADCVAGVTEGTIVHSSRSRSASEEARTPIDELLEEQQDLTAVTRFAQWHAEHDVESNPARYRGRIPLTLPRPGQQYAFEVVLDKCSGCKACVSACHSLNGLDDGEAWRDVGLLVSEDWRRPYQQTVTTACHHCVDPACLNGCPVLAYEKDPVTGIVRHLDDQCIGCQYCVLKCPYEAPKYSERRGIVRKCDLCSSRLAAGEAPACAQACPSEAIRITLVDTEAVTADFRNHPGATNTFLPASPRPDYTLPTTRYQAALGMPDSLRAADREVLRPEPAHGSLVCMLVLSQLSAGLFLGTAMLGAFLPGRQTAILRPAQMVAALAAGLVALLAAGFHLGRPLGAWRSFLGLRKSWLSREIVGFAVWLALAALDTATASSPGLLPAGICGGLSLATVAAGLLCVFCSAMVYHDTRREFWRLPATLGKFFGTTLLLGASGTCLLAVGLSPGFPLPALQIMALVTAIAGTFKLGVEHRVLRHLPDDDFSPLHKTAVLLTERLGLVNRCRILCVMAGAVCGPAVLGLQMSVPGPGAVSARSLTSEAALLFALCLLGEFIERRLFFVAVQPTRMPGGFAG